MADTTYTPGETRVNSTWLNPVNKRVYQGKNPSFVVSTGTNAAYVVTLPDSTLTALEDGQTISFQAHVSNTAGATLEVIGASSTGAIAIQSGSSGLTTGQIPINSFVEVTYLNGVWNITSSSALSNVTNNLSATGTTVINVSNGGSFTIVSNNGTVFHVDEDGNITITVPEGNTFLVTGEGDTVFQTDVIMDGNHTSFINGATITLPNSSVHPENLDEDILGALTQWLCFALCNEDEVLSGSPTITFWIPQCEILAAMTSVTVTSSSGAVTMDMKDEGAVSIFDTLPSMAAGDYNSSDDGTPAVLDSGETIVGALAPYTISVTANGTDAEGAKFYLQVRWGAPFTLPPDPDNTLFSVGMIMLNGTNSVPTGWLACDGSAVSRATYSDLFGIIGITWGAGDTTTTFNLPDIRGRAPIGVGTGGGLSARTIAQTVGVESVTLTAAESGLVAHTHTASAGGGGEIPMYSLGITESPGVTVLGAMSVKNDTPTPAFDGNLEVAAGSVTINANASAPAVSAHQNMQPSLVVPFIIKY